MLPVEFTQGERESGSWKRCSLAAGVADAMSRTVTAPIDRLKTQLQMKAYSQVPENDLKVQQRFGLGCLSGAAAHAVFYPLESIMNWARTDPTNSSDSKLFFFSFVAFASGQTAAYPLAVIRTHHQAQVSKLVESP
ncbi:hypothetical protein JZ751_018988, partial [Albula glossodonta]